jgi:hypothetical protein
VTLTAKIQNTSSVAAPVETYAFRVDVFRPSSQPFAQKQIWFLDFDRHDLDRSGVADFREDLKLYGLGSSTTETSGSSHETNVRVRAEIQSRLRASYGLGGPDAVNLDIVLSRPTGTYATICVGGRNAYPLSQLPPGAQETTGAAYVNPNNQTKNFVICDGVLGVHPRSIYWLFKDVPAFQTVFGPLQQNPVGKRPGRPGRDGARLRPAARHRAAEAALRRDQARHRGAREGRRLRADPGDRPRDGARGARHVRAARADGRFRLGPLDRMALRRRQGDFMSGNKFDAGPGAAREPRADLGPLPIGARALLGAELAYLRERMIMQ